MFIWLTVLLTLPLAWVAPILMWGVRIKTAGAFLHPDTSRKFRISSKTPIFVGHPRAWLFRIMDDRGVAGLAFLGFVVVAHDDPKVLRHEAVHVVHQSCISPFLVGLVYLLDLLAWFPWRHHWPEGYCKKASVIEKIAYKVGDERDV